VAPGTPAVPAVTIAPITLPDAVDRPELVMRSGANRLILLENRQWAEPLRTAIPRVLADSISQALGGVPVSLQSDNASRDAKLQVLIDVVRFDSMPGDAAILEASWSIRSLDGAKLRTGSSTIRVPVQGAGYDDLVAAHSQALSKLAAEISLQIKILAASGSMDVVR
jgi:uncharacterized lipoprotein YmbA